MIIWIFRIIFFLMVISMTLLGFVEGGPFYFQSPKNLVLSQWIAVLGCLGVLAIGFFVDFFVTQKKIGTLVAVFFGLVMGLLVGMTLCFLVNFMFQTYSITPESNPNLFQAKNGIFWLINVLCCYIAITFVLQTKDDFRFIIPYVEFNKQTKGQVPLILDTSVIIDGRIADVATTKIFNAPMIVPQFVLNELQKIADSPDRLRRNRGRRGLDILKKMQNNKELDIIIQDINIESPGKHMPVDHKLVAAAKSMDGKIVTNDYNLNKVASLRGVEVLNINDLANSLKTVLLPGECINVKLIKPGDQQGQGIGYLEDGTMIVVEMGRHHIGRQVEVVVTSVLQTSAGRMIFGKLNQEQANHHSR